MSGRLRDGGGRAQEDGRREGGGPAGKFPSPREPLSWPWKEERELHARRSRAEKIPEGGKGTREGQTGVREGLRAGRKWFSQGEQEGTAG